jgi:hypothetical protein
MSGASPSPIDPFPLILIVDAVPTDPELVRTWTPVARPWRRLVTFGGVARRSSSVTWIEEAALASSRRRCAPVAVTTSASSGTAETWRSKSAVTVCSAGTSTVRSVVA